MILNEKEKIEINVISRKEIIINSKWNKGIFYYIEWLENKNNKVCVIKEDNRTIITSKDPLKVFSPHVW